MGLEELIKDLGTSPTLRTELIYFPERIAKSYGVSDVELAAIQSGDMSALKLSPEDEDNLRRRLNHYGI
ncbi:hypothetical protein ACWC2T_42980 [Streptomyces sp. NPDC001393]